MKPEILAKIEKKWPHLETVVQNYRSTGNPQFSNALVNAVLLTDLVYFTPSEILYLASLRASTTASAKKSAAARENGKLGGRPRTKKEGK